MTHRMKRFLPVTAALVWLAVAPALAAPLTIDGLIVSSANSHEGHIPGLLADGDPATAWVGGGAGVGPGKWVQVTFPEPVTLSAMGVFTGHQGEGRFNDFRRLTEGTIMLSDGEKLPFAIEPKPGEQRIDLGGRTVSVLRIMITGVDPPSSDKVMGRAKVAVSEIRFYGPEPAAPTAQPEPGSTAPNPTPSGDRSPVPPLLSQSAAPSTSDPVVQSAAEGFVDAATDENNATESDPVEQTTERPVTTAAAASAETVRSPLAIKLADRGGLPTASEPGILRLLASMPVVGESEMERGTVDAWLDEAIVRRLKRYFDLMVTLDVAYPEIFAASIRQREREDFKSLYAYFMARERVEAHRAAVTDASGLSFGRPIVRGDSAVIHVSGVYRYALGETAYQFPVDTHFSIVREAGDWYVNGALDKR